MADDTGGSDYSWNIANCNKTIMDWGDPLIQEPGAMMARQFRASRTLIAKDPGTPPGTRPKSA